MRCPTHPGRILRLRPLAEQPRHLHHWFPVLRAPPRHFRPLLLRDPVPSLPFHYSAVVSTLFVDGEVRKGIVLCFHPVVRDEIHAGVTGEDLEEDVQTMRKVCLIEWAERAATVMGGGSIIPGAGRL